MAAIPLSAASYLAGDYTVRLHNCPPCLAVANSHVRADVDPRGFWVEGTTGGDPATSLDDNKRLLYGYGPGGRSLVGTGFTTIRVEAAAGITNFVASEVVTQLGRSAIGMCPPACQPPCPPACEAAITVWAVEAPGDIAGQPSLRVTETISIAFNPFSARDDVIRLDLEAANGGANTLEVGARALLDVRVADNDGAPYIIPGVGALSTERVFLGDEVPAFWLAFESPTYEATLLRALGILSGPGLTTPDRFLVAKWGRIQDTRWDYTANTTEPVTSDSAVALYWNPVPVPPGGSRVMRTAYGVAGNRGGRAFLSNPVAVRCEGFTVALFVSNFELDPLLNGVAQLSLPPGVVLSPGETLRKTLGTIDPGDTASVAWKVQAMAGQVGPVVISAVATFSGGQRFSASDEIDVSCPAPPSPTPTSTLVPTPTTSVPSPTPTPATATPSPRPTDTATPRPSPTGGAITLCPFVSGRVPAAAIASALAQPDRVSGYNQLCNPGRPRDPFNHPRRVLSLRNIAARYHPSYNGLVFKCSCP